MRKSSRIRPHLRRWRRRKKRRGSRSRLLKRRRRKPLDMQRNMRRKRGKGWPRWPTTSPLPPLQTAPGRLHWTWGMTMTTRARTTKRRRMATILRVKRYVFYHFILLFFLYILHSQHLIIILGNKQEAQARERERGPQQASAEEAQSGK